MIVRLLGLLLIPLVAIPFVLYKLIKGERNLRRAFGYNMRKPGRAESSDEPGSIIIDGEFQQVEETTLPRREQASPKA